jgi:hypothetical protein
MLRSRVRFPAIRFYIGVPFALVYLAVAAVFWRPVASWLFGSVEWLKIALSPPAWIGDFTLNLASDLTAALLIGVIVVAVFRNRHLHERCGRFEARLVENGNEVPWGDVELVYELLPTGLFDPQVRCKLIRSGDVVCIGQAIFVGDSYISGYYREVGNLRRRRTGAFTLRLNGEGDVFEGSFAYIDPSTDRPTAGTVRWCRRD